MSHTDECLLSLLALGTLVIALAPLLEQMGIGLTKEEIALRVVAIAACAIFMVLSFQGVYLIAKCFVRCLALLLGAIVIIGCIIAAIAYF